ncbi:MAG: hypothetical protein IJC07_03540 [Clostridia bacterium]|nr:hypothetical protein [Clostridia bacterium]
MVYYSIFEDVIFVEGEIPFERSLGTVEYKKKGIINEQFKNLDNVKYQLAVKAKEVGANAVIKFKYGQKNTSWFRAMILSIDDNVNWFGSGEAVLLSQEQYQEILEKNIKNQ